MVTMTKAVAVTKKRHIDDDSKDKADVDAPKPSAANAEQLPKPMLPRLCNGCLNLWLWKEGEGSEDSFDGLISLIREKTDDIRAVDVGAGLWDRFKSKEVDQVLQAIGNLPCLKWAQFSLRTSGKDARKGVSISMHVLRRLMTFSKGLQSLLLKDIELRGNSTEWTLLVEVIKAHSSLWHLRLENFSFQDEQVGLHDLIPALGANPSLKVLEIHCEQHHKEGNTLDATGVRTKANRLPFGTLKTLFCDTKSLRVLRICGLPITDDHIAEMADSLNKCKTLEELLLWKSHITDTGAKKLSSTLSSHPSLRTVNLNDNTSLSSRGCQSIFESLSTSQGSKIEELYIGCRNMDDSGRSSLLDLIAKNRTIRKLEICFSWPETATVKTLVQFEALLRRAVSSDISSVLEYVRLYNDVWSENCCEEEASELLWAVVWERCEEEEEFEVDGQDMATSRDD